MAGLANPVVLKSKYYSFSGGVHPKGERASFPPEETAYMLENDIAEMAQPTVQELREQAVQNRPKPSNAPKSK